MLKLGWTIAKFVLALKGHPQRHIFNLVRLSHILQLSHSLITTPSAYHLSLVCLV